MRRATLTILVALCSASSAHAQTWSIGDEPFPTLLSRLSKFEQQALLNGLQPGIERRAKQFDLDDAEIASAKKTLRVRRIAIKAGALTLVQSDGIELCGAVGSCAVWALDKDDRLVLETGGNGIRILKTIHHGYPSVLMFAHMSAFQTDMTWFSFDGEKYRKVRCAVKTYSDASRTYSPPKLDFGPCDK